MAQKRKAKRKAGKRSRSKPVVAETQAESVAETPPPIHDVTRPALEPETSQEAITHIAQDAVVILRRELAFRAQISLLEPGSVSMSDCIALLRLTADLSVAAMRGADGTAQVADYSRLSPQERVQLAALQLKVDYS